MTEKKIEKSALLSEPSTEFYFPGKFWLGPFGQILLSDWVIKGTEPKVEVAGFIKGKQEI